jgi:hypothetical protein
VGRNLLLLLSLFVVLVYFHFENCSLYIKTKTTLELVRENLKIRKELVKIPNRKGWDRKVTKKHLQGGVRGAEELLFH